MLATIPPARTRRLIHLLALVAVALTLAACGGSDKAANDGQIRLAYVPGLATMNVVIAQEQGFFRDNGLDVTLTPSTNLGTFAPAVGKQFDVIYGTPADLMSASDRNFPVAVISGSLEVSSESPQSMLVAGKDAGVDSIADLEGKRIAAPTLSGTLYAALISQLKDSGIPKDAVTIVEVPFPNMLDQLNAGAVDAALSVQPFVGGMLAAEHRPLGDPLLEAGDPAILGMWAADRKWAESSEETVVAFRKSLDQAAEWAAANDEDARRIIRESLQIPAEVADVVPMPTWTTEVSPTALEPWRDLLTESGQLEGDGPDLNKLVLAQ